MEKRLKKIDEFLDSLENTGLSKSQTSLILTAQNGDTSAAGINGEDCANTTPSGCSDNMLDCQNGGDNCGSSYNKKGCANVTMDAITQCVTPPPTGGNGVCPILSNSTMKCE